MSKYHVEPIDHRASEVAESIHAIQMAAYAQEAKLLGAKLFPPLQRTIKDVQKSTENFFVAIDEDAIVGAISTQPDEEPNALKIASLVVSPSYQRWGIGKQLLAVVVASYSNKLIAVTTGVKNAPALALYAQFDFVAYRKWFVEPEQLEMVKLRRQITPQQSML
ncbi:MAG: GNAT family N-acetyltransferase [Scytonematopsis contorta HA4267-MV1]|nr:GNAT family N-acetyltransferase [Scytonematopsis contorta HA4267-MV1]